MSVPRSTLPTMSPATLFLHADAALREVVDQLDPADFSASVTKEWSQLESPTLLGTLGRHAYDEAWVPDVIAGRAAADGDPLADADLLGADPIASYDALNDKATAAVRAGEFADTFRFTYGDYPADEGFAHKASRCSSRGPVAFVDLKAEQVPQRKSTPPSGWREQGHRAQPSRSEPPPVRREGAHLVTGRPIWHCRKCANHQWSFAFATRACAV